MNKYFLSIILLAVNMTYCFGQDYLTMGDDCFDRGDYACAKTNYDKIQKINYTQIVDIKLSRTNSCLSSLKAANNYYSLGNYLQAKEYYQKILDTNPKDEYAAKQLGLSIKYQWIKTFKPILDKRKSNQSYMKENPEGFTEFKNQNYMIIEKMISELKESGSVNYTTSIKFDTLGNNSSTFNIYSISTKKISNYINNSIISELRPVTESGFIIPTSDEVPFNVSWNTYKLRANFRAGKMNIKPLEKLPADFKYIISRYINQQTYANGIYKFELLNKTLNDKPFIDLQLFKYRNNNGPLNSAYSLILPGWGTLKVSDGTKGKGRMTLFLLSSIISAGCKIYSNIEYEKYIEGFASNTGANHYNNANLANQAFVASGGVAASIYIYDFIWVFSKGVKNLSLSKAYKNNIKNNPIKVVVSPLKPL